MKDNLVFKGTQCFRRLMDMKRLLVVLQSLGENTEGPVVFVSFMFRLLRAPYQEESGL